MAVSLVVITIGSMSIVVRAIYYILTVVVIQRGTIGPHMVLLEIAGDMDFLLSSLDILCQLVVCFCMPGSQLINDADKLVLDLLEVVVGHMAALLEMLEESDRLGRVVKEMPNGIMILNRVLSEVILAPVDVIDCRVEHLSYGGGTLILIIVRLVFVSCMMSSSDRVNCEIRHGVCFLLLLKYLRCIFKA